MLTKKSLIRRMILTLFTCFLLCMVAVIILFALSDEMKTHHNSFLRLFPSHVVEEGGSYNVGHNGYYVAGVTRSYIYLGNYQYPLHLLRIDTQLKDTTHVRLHIQGIEKERFWSVKIAVDSPFFYAYDGVIPRIYRGTVDSWCGERFPHDTEYFQAFEPVSNETVAIRSLQSNSGGNMLGILSVDSPYYFFNRQVLKKQVDGIFCTDGTLKYNGERRRIYYVYRYRNEIIELDTALNVTAVGHTVDTVSIAKITIATVDKYGKTTLSKPPVNVNNRIATQGRLLLVNSALLASNELPASHRNADVIDVYDLEGIEYQFSFYIHHFNGRERLRDFVIHGENLVVLYENHIQIHHLNQQYFQLLPVKNISREVRLKDRTPV